jgi:zinc-ribbon family
VFILFGIRRKAQRLAVVLSLCASCHTPAAQAITRIRTFFTLFFIPVIPLGSTYRTTCTMCGATFRVTKEQAEQLVGSAQAQARSPYPTVPPPPAVTLPAPEVFPGATTPPAESQGPAQN